MKSEPILYIVHSPKRKRSHIMSDSVYRAVCGISVGKADKATLSRLNVDYLVQNSGLCKNCKDISTKMYLQWVNSFTEYDLELIEGE